MTLRSNSRSAASLAALRPFPHGSRSCPTARHRQVINPAALPLFAHFSLARTTLETSASRSSPLTTEAFPPPSFPASFGANQILPVPASTHGRLEKILSSFDAPIQFAFGYGSGVFAQSQAGPEHARRPESQHGRKMVDFVFAVTHPEHWHALNRQQNPKHYSTFARTFTHATNLVQKAGAGLWYNPYVQIGDELVKYGVIDMDTLCSDLLDWETLYVSGRMHKPVAMVRTDARVRLAQQVNLASALRVSLLLLPEHFTEVELYTRIASLSYTGDFRMSIPGGENHDKVRNIVLGQREEFRRLYGHLIRSLGTINVAEPRKDRYSMHQDVSVEARASHITRLPKQLRLRLQQHYSSHPSQDPAFLALSLSTFSEKVTRRAAPSRPQKKVGNEAADSNDVQANFWNAAIRQKDFSDILVKKIGQTVNAPAWAQSIKGIYTAGISRSVKYVLAKIGKYFDGKSSAEKSN